MITVPAHRVKQFGVEFFQASFSAKDIDRLVKFEVLGYAGAEVPQGSKRASRARVNWEMLEKRIAETETAYQRPVIRRKIDELVAYYGVRRRTLPAIPGADYHQRSAYLHPWQPARLGPPDPGDTALRGRQHAVGAHASQAGRIQHRGPAASSQAGAANRELF